MQQYEVRKGLGENIVLANLKVTMREIFGNAEESEGKMASTFGALKPLLAWPCEKILCVETKMDPTVSNEEAQNTIKAYNTFLEKVTGYTAKERGKRAQKKAKEGKL